MNVFQQVLMWYGIISTFATIVVMAVAVRAYYVNKDQSP